MTTILPEKNKKEIKTKYLFGFVGKVFSGLIFVCLVWFVMEVTVYYVVDFEKQVLEEDVAGQDQQEKNSLVNEYREELSDAKDKVQLFDLSNNKKTEILDFVLALQTEGVSVDSISIEDGEEVTFVGVAGVSDNRESLSQFSDVLGRSEMVSDVDLPVSSFTKTFDIPFSITFIYKYE